MFQLKRGKKKPRTLHSENILHPGSATLPRALSWDEGCGGGGGEGVGVGGGGSGSGLPLINIIRRTNKIV